MQCWFILFTCLLCLDYCFVVMLCIVVFCDLYWFIVLVACLFYSIWYCCFCYYYLFLLCSDWWYGSFGLNWCLSYVVVFSWLDVCVWLFILVFAL